MTFSAHECSDQKSYVATNDSPLSVSFTDATIPDNPTSPLQLNVSDGGMVVTLRALWINTTVIIRRFSNQLSVTFQVPGHLSFESEGLCLGCPRHAYFNVTSFNNVVRDHCSTANDDTLYNCFVFGGVTNRFELTNDTYVDYCTFDTYKTESLDILSLMNAIADDAEVLSDFGFVPIRPEPSVPPILTLPPLDTSTTMSVVETTTTESFQTTAPTTKRQTEMVEEPFGLSSSTRCTLNSVLTLTAAVVTLLVQCLLR